jgi:hypothetical protein
MQFFLCKTFQDSLTRLTGQEQKAAKNTAFDLQLDPSRPGLSFHRIERSRDTNFWSIRVNADIRIIIHKTASSFLFCYVGHHDDAYDWAARRKIEQHPRTGAMQIVEIPENISAARPYAENYETSEASLSEEPFFQDKFIFEHLRDEDLLTMGVPRDWISKIQQATEDSFLQIAGHLPSEAAEKLLIYATEGRFVEAAMKMAPQMAPPPTPRMAAPPDELIQSMRESVRPSPPARRASVRPRVDKAPKAPSAIEAFEHPDSLRRFRPIETSEAFRRALESPWEQWTVFLHPSQREIVEQTYSGPARVTGSAGTGKTVVALHRAVRLAKKDPDGRLLLSTFSKPLASMLEQKLKLLIADEASVASRISVASFQDIAIQLYQLAFGKRPVIANNELICSILVRCASEHGVNATERFLVSEWTHVVDAWQLDSAEGYSSVPRLGRKNRMSPKQKSTLWPAFAQAISTLEKRGVVTWSQVFSAVTQHYRSKSDKPYNHIVIDEAQDLGVAELRMFAALTTQGPDSLFFAGDLGQRIFQQPFSWKMLDIDLQGRSRVLKVNYRTSHEIRTSADRLLPRSLRDVDGISAARSGTVSTFCGPEPVVEIHPNPLAEIEAVSSWISRAVEEGVTPGEIGVFVRTAEQLGRARSCAETAGYEPKELAEHNIEQATTVSIGTMHLAKGLEFKAVAVIGCDDEVLPLQSRVQTVADETELDDVYETERQLLYVACTRARDRLLVTGVQPASEFLKDFEAS